MAYISLGAHTESFLGELMIPGMIGSALFNAGLASSIDYTEMCDQSDKYRDAITEFDNFQTQMSKKWTKLRAEIDGFNRKIGQSTYNLTKVIKTSKAQHLKKLHRTRIISSTVTSMISLLFLLKLYLKDI